MAWNCKCVCVCMCTSLSCEEMREDSHASFMLEYTHGVGDRNRLSTPMWMVVGADGSARGGCACESPLPPALVMSDLVQYATLAASMNPSPPPD